MKKTHFCPRCNLKMRKTTVKGVMNASTPSGGFGMFSYFKPINLGGNVEYSQKVFLCPKCGYQLPIIPKAKKVKEKTNKASGKKVFWRVVLILLIIAVVLAVAAVVLYKTGHMPQSIVDFAKSIMPNSVKEFLKARLA